MGQDDLVERIASGKATLLGIDDICQRLGISRTTFDRWVRNGSISSIGKISDIIENNADGNIRFPQPDIRIGNSPKWELDTFKAWLRANIKKSV